MESDPNRLEAESIARELAEMDARLPSTGGSGADASLLFDLEAAADPSLPLAGQPALDASPAMVREPDFSSFTQPVGAPLLPRWLYVSVLSLLGAGAVILAAMFVTEERKTDKTLELVAANSRSAIDVPVVPVAAPLAAKKPTDMVFLKEASPAKPGHADRRPDSAVDRTAPVALPVEASPEEPETAPPPAVEQVAEAAPAKATPAAKAVPPKVKPVAKTATAKAKPAAKKKTPQPKKAAAVVQRGETQTWPRKRGDSITERMNAAVAACRARPHAPGECNLRACDILGSSDPACR